MSRPRERAHSDEPRPPLIGLGDRVILARATGRSRDALGTVIDLDPYRDRNAIVEVLHEDGRRRWHRVSSLRHLGLGTDREVLAADLIDLFSDAAPDWVRQEAYVRPG